METYPNPWLFEGKEVLTDDSSIIFTTEHKGRKQHHCFSFENNVGFVYLLTNLQNGRKYVGCKKFRFKTSKKVKGKKRRVKGFKVSDWKDYYGSNPTTSSLGQGNPLIFKREILHICSTQFEMKYLELKEQIERNVLFDDSYYNEVVNVRLRKRKAKTI